MRRGIYLGVFVLLSSIAGLFYYSHTRQSTALVATHDLSVGTRIQDSDVAVRQVNPGSIAPGVLRATDQAIGKVVSSPVLEGQFVDGRQVAPSRNASQIVWAFLRAQTIRANSSKTPVLEPASSAPTKLSILFVS